MTRIVASLLGLALPLALALAAPGGAIPEIEDDAVRASKPSPYGVEIVEPAAPAQKAARSGSGEAARLRGAKWLTGAQHDDGGWGAGDWSNTDNAPSDVATTAVAVLALMRDGGGVGKHRDAITGGVRFVVKAVETAPKDSPRLNTPMSTQPQSKLGQLVDTHLAALLLGEVSGKLDGETNRRVTAAMDTVVGKVQKAQQGNGAFASDGWAPSLSSSVATMGLMRARDAGASVEQEVLEKATAYQAAKAAPSGSFDASDGAGVELYAVAGALATSAQASRSGTGGRAAKDTKEAATRRLDTNTDALVAGFGSLGGEELLSYMMISDSLAAEGGQQWKDWDARMASSLSSTQNADGSWSGHHCITSRTFTTAVAVMTLGAGDPAGRSDNWRSW